MEATKTEKSLAVFSCLSFHTTPRELFMFKIIVFEVMLGLFLKSMNRELHHGVVLEYEVSQTYSVHPV